METWLLYSMEFDTILKLLVRYLNMASQAPEAVAAIETTENAVKYASIIFMVVYLKFNSKESGGQPDYFGS